MSGELVSLPICRSVGLKLSLSLASSLASPTIRNPLLLQKLTDHVYSRTKWCWSIIGSLSKHSSMKDDENEADEVSLRLELSAAVATSSLTYSLLCA